MKMQMKKKSNKNILIIGSGNIAKRHIKNIKALDRDHKVFCMSSSGKKLTKKNIGVDQIIDSFSEAKKTNFEKVIVASPSSLHIKHAMPFLKKGTSVLIEKPLSTTSKKAKKILRDSNEIKDCYVGYNLRFIKSLNFFKKCINSNKYGAINTVFCEVGQYLPEWRKTHYLKTVSANKELGGGALLELSHELDYLLWIFGMPSDVFCYLSKSKKLKLEVEDQVNSFLKFKNGLIINLHLDMLNRNPKRFCRVETVKGTLVWDFYKNNVSFQKPHSQKEILFKENKIDRNKCYLDEIRAFMKKENQEEKKLVSLNHGFKVLQIIDALRESNLRKKEVNIKN